MNVVLISTNQYGYHIDGYYHAKYLSLNKCKVKYLCFDQGHKFIENNGCNAHYFNLNSNPLFRYFSFLKRCSENIQEKDTIVLIKYFPFCFLLRLVSYKQALFVLDIRTGAIDNSAVVRYFRNSLMWLETLFFDHITIISDSLRRRLNINKKKAHVLPLGGEILNFKNKKFNELRLVYVGTFSNRNIHETVVGFAKYIMRTGDNTSTYEIIGTGLTAEEEQIKFEIIKNGLEERVRMRGYVPNNKIGEIFRSCNIGVAYIPLVPKYDCQPPTKTFEYLLSGMATIATKTYENSKIIKQTNGILIEDNPGSFCNGLMEIQRKMGYYSSDGIIKTVWENNWANIVASNLLPYLSKIVESKEASHII